MTTPAQAPHGTVDSTPQIQPNIEQHLEPTPSATDATTIGRTVLNRFLPFRMTQESQQAPQLSEEESRIAASFETNHFVTEAPHFVDVIGDTSRTNPITCFVDTASTRRREQSGALHTSQVSLSEHDALAETYAFLKAVTRQEEQPLLSDYSGDTTVQTAQTILDELFLSVTRN